MNNKSNPNHELICADCGKPESECRCPDGHQPEIDALKAEVKRLKSESEARAKVIKRVTDVSTMECPECEGHGTGQPTLESPDGYPCQRCKGRGVVSTIEELKAQNDYFKGKNAQANYLKEQAEQERDSLKAEVARLEKIIASADNIVKTRDNKILSLASQLAANQKSVSGWEETLIKDEDRLAMSDIKNRWLQYRGIKADEGYFEHDCIEEIISTQRQIQAQLTWNAKIDIQEERKSFPKVICLCGSTRFTLQMLKKQWELEREGNIVMGWAFNPLGFTSGWHEINHNQADEEGIRDVLDYAHKRKIDLADEIVVINVGGYFGDGTRSEIDYAIAHNKPVNYLDSLRSGELPEDGKENGI